MNRRRRDIAALLTIAALAGGCGGSDDDVAPTSETATVAGSDWAPADCSYAGHYEATSYRVCYSAPDHRGVEALHDGRAEDVPVEDPAGAKIGHWRWAALSPDGTTFLATWSAECEVPIAFTFQTDGGPPRPVTGEGDWTGAFESEALGWTTDGQPIVRLLDEGCGKGAGQPGTYVFETDGPRLLDRELEPSLEPRDLG